MALDMRGECEACHAGLAPGDEAYICVHECTFCPRYAAGFGYACPRCGGEQVRRPRPPRRLAQAPGMAV